MDWSSKSSDATVIKDLEFISIQKDLHPEVYEGSSAFNFYDTTGLYTIKDPSEVTMINNYLAQENQLLRFYV